MYCIHKMFKGTFVGGLVWNVHMVVEVLQEAVLAAVAHSTEAAGEHHSTHTTTTATATESNCNTIDRLSDPDVPNTTAPPPCHA